MPNCCIVRWNGNGKRRMSSGTNRKIWKIKIFIWVNDCYELNFELLFVCFLPKFITLVEVTLLDSKRNKKKLKTQSKISFKKIGNWLKTLKFKITENYFAMRNSKFLTICVACLLNDFQWTQILMLWIDVSWPFFLRKTFNEFSISVCSVSKVKSLLFDSS